MARYKLGDICEIVSGSTPKTGIEEFWDGNIKWITPAEINEDTYIINDSVRKITELAVKKTGLSPFPEGTVILSSRAPIGKVAIAGCEMYCNQGFKNLICSDVVYNKYLYWFLKGKTKYLNSLGRGATFKELSKTIVSEIPIDVPSIDDQIKIVEILEKINEIIIVRKHELEELDKLIKARFVEMFGDVKYSFERWGGKTFNEVTINFDSRRKPVKDADRKRMQGIYPYYGATGIVDYVNDYRQEGDFLLISEDGKALELRNKPIAFLASGKIWVNNHAHVQQCTDECNLIYLMYHINYMDISLWVTGIDQKKLNRANLDSIPIALPPIELQEQFAAFVNQVNKSKVGKEFNKLTFPQNETILLYISHARHTVSCIEQLALSSFNTYSR